MNKREKMMVMLVGVGAALLIGRSVVGRYRAALNEYDNKIHKIEGDLTKIEHENMMAAEAARQWREEIGPQTLSMDEKEAANRLREELYAIGEKAGLKDVTVELGWRVQTWKGLEVLTCTVVGEGSLQVVLDFMFNLHRQPYNVRCKRLSLAQAVQRIHSSRRELGGSGALKMTADLETLILPTNKMVPVFDTADLARKERKVMPRTRFGSLGEYQSLVEHRLFEPYKALPPKPLPPRPEVTSRPAVRPPKVEPLPQKPADAPLVVGRTLSSPRGQVVVLEEPGGRGEDTYKRVGDEMYGGILVFVHPKGVVTEKDGQLMFHPIGQPLQNGRALTEKDEPVVYHELLKLQEEAKGISQRPG